MNRGREREAERSPGLGVSCFLSSWFQPRVFYKVSVLKNRTTGGGEGLVDPRVVYIPGMQSNQNYEAKEGSLLMMCSDHHIFFIFKYHVVQEDGNEAVSTQVVSETQH